MGGVQVIFLVYFDNDEFVGGYYSGLDEYERGAMVTSNLAEAVIFKDYESASKIVEDYGGKVISFKY
jgi:nitrous oxide reductase accessory protein NosL